MEKLSRVQKFENLRKTIEDEALVSDDNSNKHMTSYIDKVNSVEPTLLNFSNDENDVYIPERERREFPQNLEQNFNSMDDFRNEYLDDFINEVREYNIQKGNRESDNTQIDILNQLHAVNHPKRSEYVETIHESNSEVMKGSTQNDIAAQVKSLIDEGDDSYFDLANQMQEPLLEAQTQELYGMNLNKDLSKLENNNTNIEKGNLNRSLDSFSSSKVPNSTNVTQVMNLSQMQAHTEEKAIKDSLVNDPKEERKLEVKNEVQLKEEERERALHQKLVEETQQLRVQLNEYEDDLNDLSEGVEKTNRMLNIILGFLILALLVIIGIIIFWIVQAGGVV